MSLQSTVGLARPGTRSLRATVPEGIVAFLGLAEGDQLDWRMEVDPNTQERYIIVRKLGFKVTPTDAKAAALLRKHAKPTK